MSAGEDLKRFAGRDGVRIHFEVVLLPGVGHIGAFLASQQALPHALQVFREGFAL